MHVQPHRDATAEQCHTVQHKHPFSNALLRTAAVFCPEVSLSGSPTYNSPRLLRFDWIKPRYAAPVSSCEAEFRETFCVVPGFRKIFVAFLKERKWNPEIALSLTVERF